MQRLNWGTQEVDAVAHLSLCRGGQLDLTELDSLVQSHLLVHLGGRNKISTFT